jgi:hypothetical protein
MTHIGEKRVLEMMTGKSRDYTDDLGHDTEGMT